LYLMSFFVVRTRLLLQTTKPTTTNRGTRFLVIPQVEALAETKRQTMSLYLQLQCEYNTGHAASIARKMLSFDAHSYVSFFSFCIGWQPRLALIRPNSRFQPLMLRNAEWHSGLIKV
jgi:hypothetical protein